MQFKGTIVGPEQIDDEEINYFDRLSNGVNDKQGGPKPCQCDRVELVFQEWIRLLVGFSLYRCHIIYIHAIPKMRSLEFLSHSCDDPVKQSITQKSPQINRCPGHVSGGIAGFWSASCDGF